MPTRYCHAGATLCLTPNNGAVDHVNNLIHFAACQENVQDFLLWIYHNLSDCAPPFCWPQLQLAVKDAVVNVFKCVGAAAVFQRVINPRSALLDDIQDLILVIDTDAEGVAGENAVAGKASSVPDVWLSVAQYASR